MAGHPKDRARFDTNSDLLNAASRVTLRPAPDRAVFYADDEGAAQAARFVAANPGFQRLDELLAITLEGRALWPAIDPKRNPWPQIEEVWWELSWRLARAAGGTVQVFGPRRLTEDRPLSEFRHKYATGAFGNTTFEKVELPELEQNPNVTSIFYNGAPFG